MEVEHAAGMHSTDCDNSWPADPYNDSSVCTRTNPAVLGMQAGDFYCFTALSKHGCL